MKAKETANISPQSPYLLRNPGFRPPIYPINYIPINKRKPAKPEETGPTRVELEADEVRVSGNIATAYGNAKVTYKGMKIQADKIEYDNKARQITASGAVSAQRDRDRINAKHLVFDMDNNQARIIDVCGEASDVFATTKPLVSSVYFWAKEILWTGDEIIIKKGVITTCDNPAPNYHYNISAEEIVINKQNRMKIKKGRLYSNNTLLMGLNRIVLPLRSRGHQALLPKFGRNSMEGVYAKIPIGYYWGEKDYGIVHLDWFKNVGFAGGIEHYFHLKDQGKAKIKFYNMGSSQTTARRYEFSTRAFYNLPGNFFVSGSYTSQRYEYPNYVSPNIKNIEVYLRHEDEKSKYAFLAKEYISGVNRTFGVNFQHHYKISDRYESDMILDYTSLDDSKNQKYRLNTLARIVNRGDIFDTHLIFDHTWGDGRFCTSRLPEMSMRSHPIAMGPFESRVSLSAGNFKEYPSYVSALRSDIRFSLLNKVFPLGDTGVFAVAGGFRQLLYGNGDKKYLIRSQTAIEENLGDFFNIALSHYYQNVKGHSPLAMDTFDEYNMLGATVGVHHKDKVRLDVTGGYDMDRKLFQTIIPRMEVCPSDNFRLLLGSSYDRNNRLWTNIDGEIGLKISKKINLKYWGYYDLINKKMTYRNYVVEYDTHDFITRLVYRGSQKEFWLDVTLKILPYEDITVGPDVGAPIIEKKDFDGALESEYENP